MSLLRRTLERLPRIATLPYCPSTPRAGAREARSLGDRIRMNSIGSERVYMQLDGDAPGPCRRPRAVVDAPCWRCERLVSTWSSGNRGHRPAQPARSPISPNLSLYVMTPEYGAPSQLEKIDMLDYADLVVINKADKRGAKDAVQYVAKQVQRNRGLFGTPLRRECRSLLVSPVSTATRVVTTCSCG
jgi:methylmalonyl-CoA mutase